MGNRRTIRRIRKNTQRLVLIIFILSCVWGQSEYQILMIPNNSFKLSVHNGLDALDLKKEFKDSTISNTSNNNYILSYLQYPSQINLVNFSYKRLTLKLLNYGLFEDKIDNYLINSFYSYEYLIQYNFHREIFNMANMDISLGCLYSNIASYSSSAVISNIKFDTYVKQKKVDLAISIKNIGIILDSYTRYNQQLPLSLHFSIIKHIDQPRVYVGYDLIYNHNINDLEQIISIQADINQLIKLRCSTTNYKNDLMIVNSNKDLFYGLAFGISIETEKISLIDIGISSLGAAGYIYGLTINF